MQSNFSENLEKIKIVLVGTTHPGNIGAAARAMKTMGLRQLNLVSPKIYPSADVTARAAGADDILAEAQVFSSLQEAISDCSLIYATSARMRSIQWPVYTPEQAARLVTDRVVNNEKCAIIFGRESSGLSNEELECCNAMIQIQSNSEYSSLNLASAVQIICYELRKQFQNDYLSPILDESDKSYASNEQMEQFYQHLEQCLIGIDYYDPEKPRLLMRRLRRLFNRSQLEKEEYSILRGILTAIDEKIK